MEFTIKEMNHIFYFIIDCVCGSVQNTLVTIDKEICDRDTMLRLLIGYNIKYEKDIIYDKQSIEYWFTFINKKDKKTEIYTTTNLDSVFNHWSNEKIK